MPPCERSMAISVVPSSARFSRSFHASPPLPAEIATYGDQAVIIVRASAHLRERTGVELLPLPDGRALICFDERMSISDFELRIRDVLSDSTVDGDDRAVFETLANILKNTRRSDSIALERRSIIVLNKKTTRPPATTHVRPQRSSPSLSNRRRRTFSSSDRWTKRRTRFSLPEHQGASAK